MCIYVYFHKTRFFVLWHTLCYFTLIPLSLYLCCSKHMREAADRRQQLEAEHEKALAFLNSRQQEIHLLQKVINSITHAYISTHKLILFLLFMEFSGI